MLSMLLDGAVDVLDISEDLRKAAVKAYEEVGAWLADHGNPGCRVYPQGSFLLGTVVRPGTPGGEYDIDLVIWLLLAREVITQSELKERVGRLLDDYRKWKADQGHADGPHSLESRRRCWTLGYQGFHLDVLPAIPDDEHPPTGILLTDENLFRWQHSNPIGYADWFKGRSEMTRVLLAKRHASVADVPTWRTRTPLQRVVQILKWHCMITFAADLDNRPPSILITTLAGRAYDGEPDLFTAVRGVLDNMTQYVERRARDEVLPALRHRDEQAAAAHGDDRAAHRLRLVHRAPATRAHLPWSPPARLTSACNSPRSRAPCPKHRERYMGEYCAAPPSCSPRPPAAATPRG
jgi:hypothetical protein